MRAYLTFASLLATAALAACSEGATAPSGSAKLRVVNVAATAGAMVRRIDNGATAAIALNDTASGTTLVTLTPGNHQIRVYQGVDTTGAVLVNTTLTVRENESYAVVVSGNLPAAPAAPTLRSTVLQVQPFALPAGTLSLTGVFAALPASAAAVRVVHVSANANGAAPTTPTFNAYLYSAATARPATATLASAAFPSASDFQFVDVSAAPYKLDITNTAGTLTRGTIASLTLAGGNIRTVLVLDGATAATVQFVVLNDN